MSDHSHHAHGTPHHHAGASVHHAPTADALGAYAMARDAAQPAPGGRVVTVDLEAAEFDWEFSPGRVSRAWGYNGQVPGGELDVEPPASREEAVAVRLMRRRVEQTVHAEIARAGADLLGRAPLQHETQERSVVCVRRDAEACGVRVFRQRDSLEGVGPHGRSDKLSNPDRRGHRASVCDAPLRTRQANNFGYGQR